MCISFLNYPENFILSNAKKQLKKELDATETTRERKMEIHHVLKTCSSIKTEEQQEIILPGNAFLINISSSDTLSKNGDVYAVLDGTISVNDHELPPKIKILLSSSLLGKKLIGKKKGASFPFEGKTVFVKEIYLPSKSKWVFKYPAEKKTKVESSLLLKEVA